jgi:hypothetical protein
MGKLTTLLPPILGLRSPVEDADWLRQTGEQKEALERLAEAVERLKTLLELQAIKDARTKKPVINTAQIAYITHETDKGIVVTVYSAWGEKIELHGQLAKTWQGRF